MSTGFLTRMEQDEKRAMAMDLPRAWTPDGNPPTPHALQRLEELHASTP